MPADDTRENRRRLRLAPKAPAGNSGPGWSWKQRFSFRAATAILLFVLAVIVCGTNETLYHLLTRSWPWTADLFWRFGVNLGRYGLAGALLALGYLLRSIWRRNPQLQFFLEMLLGLALYLWY